MSDTAQEVEEAYRRTLLPLSGEERLLRAARLFDAAREMVLASLPPGLGAQLLILDDWLRDPLSPTQTRDILEILDDRYRRSSTILATQVPVDGWHERLSDPTLADALLDRSVHHAYRLALTGESRRKTHSPLTHVDHLSL